MEILEKNVASNTKCGNWYKVRHNGTVGYACGKYIGDVPENFRPAGTDTKMFALWVTNPWPFKLSDNTSSSGSIGITCSLKINSYGVLTCDVKGEYSGSGKLLLGAQIDSADSANIRLQCNFGYEALPLK